MSPNYNHIARPFAEPSTWCLTCLAICLVLWVRRIQTGLGGAMAEATAEGVMRDWRPLIATSGKECGGRERKGQTGDRIRDYPITCALWILSHVHTQGVERLWDTSLQTKGTSLWSTVHQFTDPSSHFSLNCVLREQVTCSLSTGYLLYGIGYQPYFYMYNTVKTFY